MTKQEVYKLITNRKLDCQLYKKFTPEMLMEEAKSCGYSNEVVESLNETYTCISKGLDNNMIYSYYYINKVARLFSKTVKLMLNEIDEIEV